MLSIRKMFQRLMKRGQSASVTYPLALTPNQIVYLKDFYAGPSYAAFQHIVSELAQVHLNQLLNANAKKVEFERGALAMLNEIHDVVSRILTKCEVIDDRTKHRNSESTSTHKSPAATFWGSPFWDWKRGP